MPRIQLLADTENFSAFSAYLESIDEIELVGDSADIVLDAGFLHPRQKLEGLAKLDAHKSIVISNTLTVSATTAQQAVGPQYTIVGMPILPHYFVRQKTIEYSYPFGSSPDVSAINDFLSIIGKSGEHIEDGIGGVFPRTLAMIVNEAAFAVQESVAVAADIDIAMKLGTNYPQGPLAWCDEIGARTVVAILDALSGEYGSERYRVSTLLRRHAEAGVRFTPELASNL